MARTLASVFLLLLAAQLKAGEAAWAWALAAPQCPNCEKVWKDTLKECPNGQLNCTCGCREGHTCTCVQKQAYDELYAKVKKDLLLAAVFVGVDVPQGYYIPAVRWDGYPNAKGKMVVFLRGEGGRVMEIGFKDLDSTAAKVVYDCSSGTCHK